MANVEEGFYREYVREGKGCLLTEKQPANVMPCPQQMGVISVANQPHCLFTSIGNVSGIRLAVVNHRGSSINKMSVTVSYHSIAGKESKVLWLSLRWSPAYILLLLLKDVLHSQQSREDEALPDAFVKPHSFPSHRKYGGSFPRFKRCSEMEGRAIVEWNLDAATVRARLGLSDDLIPWLEDLELIGPPTTPLPLPAMHEVSDLFMRLGISSADAAAIIDAWPTPDQTPEVW